MPLSQILGVCTLHFDHSISSEYSNFSIDPYLFIIHLFIDSCLARVRRDTETEEVLLDNLQHNHDKKVTFSKPPKKGAVRKFC